MKSLNIKDIQLSKNFWLREFIVSQDHPELLPEIWENLTSLHITKCRELATRYLQPLRDHFGIPLIIISGIRNLKLNKKVKGADNSLHLFLGTDAAIDFTIGQQDKTVLWSIFYFIQEYFTVGEAILYLTDQRVPRFVHISLPNKKDVNQILCHYKNKFWVWDEWAKLK